MELKQPPPPATRNGDHVADYKTRREKMLSVHAGDGLLGSSPDPSCFNPNNSNPIALVRPNKNIMDENEPKNNKVAAAATLNPDAQAWHPKKNSAPEEDRCLFLTFSNGYPLTHGQIIKFFTRMYGSCVERAYVHDPEPKKSPPLFGKVVFYSSLIPSWVMGSEKQVKFMVDKRPLWCKRFEPRNRRDCAAENNADA